MSTTVYHNSDAHETQSPTDFLAQTTLPFPRKVPIFESFPHEDFYVRACFAEYYDHITNPLHERYFLGDTVFGAPGVGTSVFLAYFLLRYQREHPTTTFVMISYNSRSLVKQAVVWKDGAVVRTLSPRQVKRAEDLFEAQEDVIFLLNGPPRIVPFRKHRHVVCTPINQQWIDAIYDDDSHETLYMPLWDVDELTAAVQALGLSNTLPKMTDLEGFPRQTEATELEYRFRVFGGVARPCLATTEDVLNTAVTVLREAAASVHLHTGFRPTRPRDREREVSYALFHCYPSSDCVSSQLKPASSYVTQLLTARVQTEISAEEREKFEQTVSIFPAASVLRNTMIATRARALLVSGVRLVVPFFCFRHKAEDLQLTIDPSLPKAITLPSGFSASNVASGGLYFLPPGNGFEVIVGVYTIRTQEQARACGLWGNVETVVFLTPGPFTYQVPGRDLYKLLKRLGLENADPKRTALVFAVAEVEVARFHKQHVYGCYCPHDGASFDEVDGVTTEMTVVLEEAGVCQVRDLRRLPDRVTLSEDQARVYEQAQALLSVHMTENVVEGGPTHEMLEDIPQFMWVVKD